MAPPRCPGRDRRAACRGRPGAGDRRERIRTSICSVTSHTLTFMPARMRWSLHQNAMNLRSATSPRNTTSSHTRRRDRCTPSRRRTGRSRSRARGHRRPRSVVGAAGLTLGGWKYHSGVRAPAGRPTVARSSSWSRFDLRRIAARRRRATPRRHSQAPDRRTGGGDPASATPLGGLMARTVTVVGTPRDFVHAASASSRTRFLPLRTDDEDQHVILRDPSRTVMPPAATEQSSPSP